MAYTILTAMARYILWPGLALSASAHAFSVSGEGTLSAADTVTSKFVLLQLLRALATKEFWENRSLTAGALLGLLAIITVQYSRSPWRKLPPSPRRLPIIGNALQIVDTKWMLSKDCKERFGMYEIIYSRPGYECRFGLTTMTGELMYLDAAGQPTLVLNSIKSNYELLERRSTTYASRPRFIMVQEILSNGLMFSLLKYGDR
jgi:hypothetical protein